MTEDQVYLTIPFILFSPRSELTLGFRDESGQREPIVSECFGPEEL